MKMPHHTEYLNVQVNIVDYPTWHQTTFIYF